MARDPPIFVWIPEPARHGFQSPCCWRASFGIALYPRQLSDTYRASIKALVKRVSTAMALVQHPTGAAVMRQVTLAVALPPIRQAPALKPGPS